MPRPRPTSILSLDVGKKRVGLAGCDPLGITITPLPPLHRTSFKKELEILKNYCQKRNVEGLVIGIPLNQNCLPTKQAKYCENYGLKVAKCLCLPIAWVNEHSSTWAAGEKNNLKKDRSGKLDSASAAVLLEQWLLEGPELKPVKMASNPASQLGIDERC